MDGTLQCRQQPEQLELGVIFKNGDRESRMRDHYGDRISMNAAGIPVRMGHVYWH